jgi:protoporphyrinogen/coproporphyrinogen III oxidase
MSNNNNRVAIIGAGITGLTAAWELQKLDVDVEIFERKGEVGGAIKTVRNGEWQVEYGPNTLLLKDRVVAGFLSEIGLSGDKVAANSRASKRFIVKQGKLEPLPSSLISAVTSSLFSAGGKLRILAEPFISRSDDPDQTVAQFVKRRLGRELLNYGINPFVAGIYANRPEDLSLRHAFPMMHSMEQEYGSLILGAVRGAKKRREEGRIDRELISFKDGMQQLPQTIARHLKSVNLNHEVTSIQREGDKWHLETNMGHYGEYDRVILNAPLYKIGDALIPGTAQEQKVLNEVTYPPLSVMLLGFKKEDIVHPLDGFGFLVPEVENRKILGALFSSTLFEGRAPSGSHLMTVFIGGGRQPELAGLKSEKLLQIVLDELRELIGLSGEPQFKDHIYWPRSIPGYHVGYDRVLQAMESIEKKNQGLILAGNFRNGISVPDCIKNGLKLAESIAASK